MSDKRIYSTACEWNFGFLLATEVLLICCCCQRCSTVASRTMHLCYEQMPLLSTLPVKQYKVGRQSAS